MSHKCNCLVVTCIDFRFQKFIKEWIAKNLKDKTYDMVGLAGSTKDLKTILKQLAISKKLHAIAEVILMHHEDCGAYGKKGTKAKHCKDLKKARKTMLTLYPDLKVYLYYLRLNGKFEEIN